MKTESELEEEILAITLKIQDQFPELSDFLIETPIKYAEGGTICRRSLKDYRNSLSEMVYHFAKTHG